MGAGEGEAIELRNCFPGAGRFAAGLGVVSFEKDSIARDGMPYAAERTGFRNLKLSCRRGETVILKPNLDVGKFPKMSIDGPAGSLPDEEPVLFPRDEGHESPFRGRRTSRTHGEFVEAIFAEGKTKLAHGANGTFHLARRADKRAQLHQGLVQVRTARGNDRNQIAGQLPQGCVGLFVAGVAFDAENPA